MNHWNMKNMSLLERKNIFYLWSFNTNKLHVCKIYTSFKKKICIPGFPMHQWQGVETVVAYQSVKCISSMLGSS